MDLDTPLEAEESRTTPALSILLGIGPMLPFVAAAILAWNVQRDLQRPIIVAATVWGGAILCFLAGVRRGLSFRTRGGARLSQILTMFFLFVLGLGDLATVPASAASPAGLLAGLAMLWIGFVAIAVLDPRSAPKAGAPPFFATLRPWQMSIPAVCIPLLALRIA